MIVPRQVEEKPPLPILYEDEEVELGESNPHVVADVILFVGLRVHLAEYPEYQVYANMNLYYQDPESTEVSPLPYVSPDTMVVTPFHRLPEDVSSYQIGREGPTPVLTVEILSERSAQQRDLDEKVTLYARLGVAEYILIDVRGNFMPERLLLKRLRSNGTWQDIRDPDGGITSRLGFRLLVDEDGFLRVVNAATGKPYLRPEEAQGIFEAEAKARQRAETAEQQERRRRQEAEAQLRELTAEVARLQEKLREEAGPSEE